MRRSGVALAVCALALAAPVSSASADVASDMNAELVSNGVPNVTVTVATPPAATSSDASAWQADAAVTYPSLSPLNLLSAEPTFPRPVATVTFGPASATMWPGFVRAPGVPGWEAVEDALVPIWRLEIMQALKHRLGAGAELAGVAMQPNLPSHPSPGMPDLYLTPPDAADFPSAPPSQSMSTASVEAEVKQNLPPGYVTASVSVSDRPGGQRVVTVSQEMVPQRLAVLPPSGIIGYLAVRQQQLNDQGANIGSMIFRITDPTTRLPVFTYAGDAAWGQAFSWVAPLARPYVSGSRAGLSGDPAGDITGLINDTVSPPTG